MLSNLNSGLGRILFVFIDDLDRCEIPKAAELLQAINLLLSADQGNLFFVLGLDREMVAAGIAAKNEKILPYLAAGRTTGTFEKIDIHQVGVEYGYNFMEKFVQVPFGTSRPDEREIAHWISVLIDAGAVSEIGATEALQQQGSFGIIEGSDPEEFEQVIQRVAQLFQFNPRRLKQFVNVFRLRVMIALTTRIVVPAQPNRMGRSLSVALPFSSLAYLPPF